MSDTGEPRDHDDLIDDAAAESIIDEVMAGSDPEEEPDEAALRADPVFVAAVEQGRRWETAQNAAVSASKPYRDTLRWLIVRHPDGWPEGSEKGRQFRALTRVIQDAELQAHAQHGIQPAKSPETPKELLAMLRAITMNWWFDLQERTNQPRPTNFLWRDAEKLAERDSSLPELPDKPDDGRKRIAMLVQWCDHAISQRPSDPADAPVKQTTMSPDDLIDEFKELAQADPDMRIDRKTVADVVTLRIAGHRSVQTRRKFKALASDAAALFAPDGEGNAETRWLEIVVGTVPELVEDANSPCSLGYATVEDGRQIQFTSESVPNAASASVLAVRRLRERIKTTAPEPPVPEAAIESAGTKVSPIERIKRLVRMIHPLVSIALADDRSEQREGAESGLHNVWGKIKTLRQWIESRGHADIAPCVMKGRDQPSIGQWPAIENELHNVLNACRAERLPEFDREALVVRWCSNSCDFTAHPTRFKLLDRLIRRPNAKISVDALREEGWQDCLVADATVKAEIQRLKQQLKDEGMEHLATAIRQRTIDRTIHFFFDLPSENKCT